MPLAVRLEVQLEPVGQDVEDRVEAQACRVLEHSSLDDDVLGLNRYDDARRPRGAPTGRRPGLLRIR